MLDILKLNLQLFADGDGGSSGESDGGNGTGEEIPAFIPEKAKSVYKKAMERTKANVPQSKTETQSAESTDAQPAHIPFSDLIKSDEYKDEHKAYMDKTIGDRLKKYKDVEKNNSEMRELLDLAASKYGLDTNADDFLGSLKEKMEADDSFYEQYAMDNDISTEEARKVVSLERKVAKAEAEEKQREIERVAQERNIRLVQSAERTKAQFPGFDLETELQNPQFVRLCQSTNEDTTAAYITCHWGEIIPNTVQMASQKAQIQTANAIASNKSRPIENGLSSNATATVQTDYSQMNLQQIREQADRWRRGLK